MAFTLVRDFAASQGRDGRGARRARSTTGYTALEEALAKYGNLEDGFVTYSELTDDGQARPDQPDQRPGRAALAADGHHPGVTEPERRASGDRGPSRDAGSVPARAARGGRGRARPGWSSAASPGPCSAAPAAPAAGDHGRQPAPRSIRSSAPHQAGDHDAGPGPPPFRRVRHARRRRSGRAGRPAPGLVVRGVADDPGPRRQRVRGASAATPSRRPTTRARRSTCRPAA